MNSFNRVMDELEPTENSKKLRTMLVNYERNKTWLDEVVYEPIEDLALCACIVDTQTNKCSAISRVALFNCGLTEKDVMLPAKADATRHYTLENMTAVLYDLCEMIEKDKIDVDDNALPVEPAPLWVLTTDDNLYGAALMGDMSILNKVRDNFLEDFYILPSSIYEVLILPKSNAKDMSADDLKNMVQQINKTEVDKQDQLSDNVYFFNGEELTIAR